MYNLSLSIIIKNRERILSILLMLIQTLPLSLRLYVALVRQQLSKVQLIISLDALRASTSFAK